MGITGIVNTDGRNRRGLNDWGKGFNTETQRDTEATESKMFFLVWINAI
jgi:hypothetical protein